MKEAKKRNPDIITYGLPVRLRARLMPVCLVPGISRVIIYFWFQKLAECGEWCNIARVPPCRTELDHFLKLNLILFN